ncbi:MAG: chemotaxis protein CheW [Gemmatimonadales bacterium]|nr:chemotaxis protein CheW [Gemmatimonadales bacterium]
MSAIAADAGAPAGHAQYLTFVLAGEEYGVDILRVQEIKGWDVPTPIPNTPDHIRGVINLRGTIVPIVDLRRRFGLPVAEYGPMTVVIVLKVHGADRQRIIGIVVDAVSDVCSVGGDELRPPPDFGGAVAVDFVRGLATVGGRMTILLDIDQLLDAVTAPAA